MGRDIYMRDETDPDYKPDLMEVTDELEQLLSQIRMMLFTQRGEVLGAPDFGAGLEDMLFTQFVNEYALRSALMDQTMKFIPLAEKYGVDYSVKFARGTVRDICIIDVRVLDQSAFGIVVK